MEIDKKDLLSFYVSADPSLNSKTKKAIADWVVKFLFKQEEMTKDDIINTFSRILEAKMKDCPQFDEALSRLIENDVIEPKGKAYRLSDTYREKITLKMNNVNALRDHVYNTYFKNADLSEEVVRNWFNDVTICIFEKYFFDLYGDDFHAESVHDNYYQEIEKIIDNESSHLSASKDTLDFLKTKYFAFLKENDNQSAQLFLHYGMANFSAMLFTSSNFVNRITLDVFENMTLLLDTNVLLVLRTKEGDSYEAFPLLESIFKLHNVKLEFLKETIGEYDRSIKHNHENMRAIVKSGSQRSILQPMTERNVFLRAIKERGYTSVEDVDKMFDSQKSIPEIFYQDVPITQNEKIKNDSSDYQQEIERMSEAIIAFQQKLGTNGKTGNRLAHDAALLAAAKILRSRGEKYAILTSDYVLQEYAKEEVKNNDVPIALSFSAVVTMLEYFQSDPTSHASNVAPVFKRMLTSEMLSLPEEIAPQDISRVYSYNRDIKMLDDASFKELIYKVKEKQLNNDSDDDIADMISTFIDSRIQRNNDEDYASRQKIRDLERRLETSQTQTNETKSILKDSVRNNVISDRKIEWLVSWIKVVAFVVFALIADYAMKAVPDDIKCGYWDIFANVFSIVGGFGLIWRFVEYKHLSKKWIYNETEIMAEVNVRMSQNRSLNVFTNGK